MEIPQLLAALGPRAFLADLATPEVCRVIAQSTALGYFKTALLGMAQHEQAQLFDEIAEISRQNRLIENTAEFKACDGLGYPSHRIPLGMWNRFEDVYGIGCWKDPEFVEDTLKHHPGLRIKVTRGTRGQQYVGGGGCAGRMPADASRMLAVPSAGERDDISGARVRDGAAERAGEPKTDAIRSLAAEPTQAPNGGLGAGHENAARVSESSSVEDGERRQNAGLSEQDARGPRYDKEPEVGGA